MGGHGNKSAAAPSSAALYWPFGQWSLHVRGATVHVQTNPPGGARAVKTNGQGPRYHGPLHGSHCAAGRRIQRRGWAGRRRKAITRMARCRLS